MRDVGVNLIENFLLVQLRQSIGQLSTARESVRSAIERSCPKGSSIEKWSLFVPLFETTKMLGGELEPMGALARLQIPVAVNTAQSWIIFKHLGS